MNNILNISSKINFEEIISTFTPDKIDYFYTETQVNKRGSTRHFLSVQFKSEISSVYIAKELARFILAKYEPFLLQEMLSQNFLEFSDNESREILNTATNSMAIFDQIYNEITIVKNLTKYLDFYDSLSIEGFLNFRATEYKRVVRMVLSDAIDKFLIKEEYNDFVEMLKCYINDSEPQIDLIHIKPNLDGSFSFYNFKKNRIIFQMDEINPIENFMTNEDMLISILIALMPKRIIWHNNLYFEFENIKTTISKVFGNRFCICNGCELCNSQ
ncbi:MAG: putative sporulation protein YtxC [Clostridia bacterium]|nr:putative sporulation protein YtxC [Clostridia bacterium]